ncbi:histidine phosphatase family protein [Roseomonas sp. CCTCC AB2023176]|uniref:histidine phosphatase family protein n=1 Tax=Roseomonas sp. CCTCC AB2023176 TaxID=3342640 RepID=UPI0035E244E2
MPTRLHLIRHALVEPSARLTAYGAMDVPLCALALAEEVAAHAWLADRLPQPARWYCTPLMRTKATAAAIFAAGYPEAELTPLDGFVEQRLGEWEGLAHDAFIRMLTLPAHPFWMHGADEKPPGGESFRDVMDRVAPAMQRIVDENPDGDAIVVAHGGSIRAAIACAMELSPFQAFQFSVKNLSHTRLEAEGGHWRVITINEEPPLG